MILKKLKKEKNISAPLSSFYRKEKKNLTAVFTPLVPLGPPVIFCFLSQCNGGCKHSFFFLLYVSLYRWFRRVGRGWREKKSRLMICAIPLLRLLFSVCNVILFSPSLYFLWFRYEMSSLTLNCWGKLYQKSNRINKEPFLHNYVLRS